MSDGKCSWCGKPLSGQVPTGLPAYDGDSSYFPDTDRYCSAKCIYKRVEQLFHRRKRIVRTGPNLGEIEDEKWPRFTAEIPPELAQLLEDVHKRRLGVNAAHATRAGLVRAGLRLYLETYAEAREPAIDTTAEEIDSPELTP